MLESLLRLLRQKTTKRRTSFTVSMTFRDLNFAILSTCETRRQQHPRSPTCPGHATRRPEDSPFKIPAPRLLDEEHPCNPRPCSIKTYMIERKAVA